MTRIASAPTPTHVKVYGPSAYLKEEINELLNYYRAFCGSYFPTVDTIKSLGNTWYRIMFSVPRQEVTAGFSQSVSSVKFSRTRYSTSGKKIHVVREGRIIHMEDEVFDHYCDTANWRYWTNVATIVALPNGGFAVRGVKIDYNCVKNSTVNVVYYSNINALNEKLKKRGCELDDVEIAHLTK